MGAPETALHALGAVPDLDFEVEGAEVLRYAAAPTLVFRVRIANRGDAPIRSLALTTQVRIAATRRSYDERAQARLVELFGEPSRWSQTLRSLLWANTTLFVPGFTESTVAEMPLACTYDFDVAATKYFHALADGDVPLEFLFSGSVFYAGPQGLQTTRISWDKEAQFRLPVRLWKEMMEHYFPGTAWLRVRTETFDRLYAYKAERALASWEDAIEALLAAAEEGGGR
ncbi:MAG: DUF6084 family protein [Actinomycetota bacterium]|nr:DUF6084 family protein [Actinomycetota bacterium]